MATKKKAAKKAAKKQVTKKKTAKATLVDTAPRNSLGQRLFPGPNGKLETLKQRNRRLRRNKRVAARRKLRRAERRAAREAQRQAVQETHDYQHNLEIAAADEAGPVPEAASAPLAAPTRFGAPRKDIVIGPEEVTTYVDGKKRGTHFDVVIGARWAVAQAVIARETGAFTVAIHDLRGPGRE